VTIKRVERTKRKCTIVVAGLEACDVDLKKAAKLFATKFACGSSVTKNPAGFDEIVIQGDLQDDVFALIRKTWKEVCVILLICFFCSCLLFNNFRFHSLTLTWIDESEMNECGSNLGNSVTR
jgi:translation initiation factor 1 (eIF-1/SUI1)